MRIEKIERGYRIHHAAGGFTELWGNHSGAESAACAAIDYLLEQAKHEAAEVWAKAYKQGVDDTHNHHHSITLELT